MIIVTYHAYADPDNRVYYIPRCQQVTICMHNLLAIETATLIMYVYY